LWKNLEANIFNAESRVDIENDHHSSHGLSKKDLRLQDQIRRLYALSDLP
jgi:pterin-4a-carbinolamine dehydratase